MTNMMRQQQQQGGFSLGVGPEGRLDLLVVKVRLGDDIRRLAVNNSDLTFHDLTLLLRRVFAKDLGDAAMVIKCVSL